MGSLSHTGDLCLAAVARSSDFIGLGVDIEHRGRVSRDLWPVIFSSAEIRGIEAEREGMADLLASVLFGAKEAYFKFQFPIWAEWLDFLEVEAEAQDGFVRISPIAASRAPPSEGCYGIGEEVVCVCVYQARTDPPRSSG